MTKVKEIRWYGDPPYRVAVIHGGPGTPGYMAPVARELRARWGVAEPLQTRDSLEGQVEELIEQLETCGGPVKVVGSSWGAMLGFITAARRPDLIERLIMVGSAVFDAEKAKGLWLTRSGRLTAAESDEAERLLRLIEIARRGDNDALMEKLGRYITKADAYDPLTLETEATAYQYDLFRRVWLEVDEFRRSGGLEALAPRVRCPITVIHGDYDPHPWDGVVEPLRRMFPDLRFYLLEKCGHLPWIEKHAKARFFEILRRELSRRLPV